MLRMACCLQKVVCGNRAEDHHGQAVRDTPTVG